jgi:hypothetical protein
LSGIEAWDPATYAVVGLLMLVVRVVSAYAGRKGYAGFVVEAVRMQ